MAIGIAIIDAAGAAFIFMRIIGQLKAIKSADKPAIVDFIPGRDAKFPFGARGIKLRLNKRRNRPVPPVIRFQKSHFDHVQHRVVIKFIFRIGAAGFIFGFNADKHIIGQRGAESQFVVVRSVAQPVFMAIIYRRRCQRRRRTKQQRHAQSGA